jgi:hypothetical protein
MAVVSSPEAATDSTYPMFPHVNNLCNYITARPSDQNHAEAQLTNNFDVLLRKYRSSTCQTIVLYTWLLPCARCTRKIKDKLGWGRQQARVVIVYTSKMQGVTEYHAREIVSDLEAAGITVIQENCDSLIPPA